MTVVVWHIGIHGYHASNVVSEVQVVPWTRPIPGVADFHLARKKMHHPQRRNIKYKILPK